MGHQRAITLDSGELQELMSAGTAFQSLHFFVFVFALTHVCPGFVYLLCYSSRLGNITLNDNFFCLLPRHIFMVSRTVSSVFLAPAQLNSEQRAHLRQIH